MATPLALRHFAVSLPLLQRANLEQRPCAASPGPQEQIVDQVRGGGMMGAGGDDIKKMLEKMQKLAISRGTDRRTLPVA